jgi:hypothetical protein
MTAREIIEKRLGRKLAPTRELRPDEREAVKRLAQELIKARKQT